MDLKVPVLLRAGAATVPIPIPVGGLLDGYHARTAVSTGVLRPLECNAVMLEVDGGRILLLSVDAIAVDAVIARRIRRAVSVNSQVDDAAILVCASHTHAGPAGLREAAVGSENGFDQHVVDAYVSAALAAAHFAATALQDAALSFSVGEVVGVAANRRDPSCAVNSRATLLSVDAAAGEPIAKIWNFACHATVLGSSNTLISPDLPGEVRACLREANTPEMPVAYLPGFGGDVSTRFTRRGQSPAELERLARIVVGSWQSADVPTLRRPRSWQTTMVLPAVEDNPVAVERRLAAAESAYEAEPDGPGKRQRETTIQGLRRRLAWCGSSHRSNIEADVQAIALGDLAFAALPGEPMSTTGDQVRLASSHALTLPVGYTNGYVGYLPTSDMDAGYETEAAVVRPGSVDAAVRWFADRLGGDTTDA